MHLMLNISGISVSQNIKLVVYIGSSSTGNAVRDCNPRPNDGWMYNMSENGHCFDKALLRSAQKGEKTADTMSSTIYKEDNC